MAAMGQRLLLADDHAVFVEALAKLLRSRYEVVEVVSDGRALCEAARQYNNVCEKYNKCYSAVTQSPC